MEPALHPEVRALAFLLGRWEGEGEGVWPPGEPFRYGEETTFEHVGEAYLAYSQRSWSMDDGAPLHLERGFFRPGGAGLVEVAMAHPLGIVEVAEGSIVGSVIDVDCTRPSSTTTGSPIARLRRRIEVEGDLLRYQLWMATEEVPLTRHLRAELKRV